MPDIGAAARIAAASLGGTLALLVSLAWLAQTGLPSATVGPIVFGSLALGAAAVSGRARESQRPGLEWLGLSTVSAWMAGGAAFLGSFSRVDAGLDLEAERALLVIGPAWSAQILLSLCFLPAWGLSGAMLARLLAGSQPSPAPAPVALLSLAAAWAGYRALVEAAGTVRLGLVGMVLLLAAHGPERGRRRWLFYGLAGALAGCAALVPLEAGALRSLLARGGSGSLAEMPQRGEPFRDRFTPWGRLVLAEAGSGLAAFFDGRISFVLPRGEMPSIAEAQELYGRADLAAAHAMGAGDRVAVVGSGAGMLASAAVRLGAAEVVWVDPLCLADRMQLAADRERIPWLAHPALAIACENPRRFLSRRPAAFEVVALAAPVVGWTAPLDVHDLEAPLYTAEGARVLKDALAPGGILMLPRYLVTDRNAAVVRQAASALEALDMAIRIFSWPAPASRGHGDPLAARPVETLLVARKETVSAEKDRLATLANSLPAAFTSSAIEGSESSAIASDDHALRLGVFVVNLDRESASLWLAGSSLWLVLVALALGIGRRSTLPLAPAAALSGAAFSWLALTLAARLQLWLACPLDGAYYAWAASAGLAAGASAIANIWARRRAGPAPDARPLLPWVFLGAGAGWLGTLVLHFGAGAQTFQIPATLASLFAAVWAMRRRTAA